MKKTKSKGRSVQQLLGIQRFTDYGLLTDAGELLFYHQLGKMLLFGQSITKDVERGTALLQASAAQGNAYAQTILDDYGKPPVTFVGLRLLASVSRLLQGRIQEDHKQMPQVDKKLRQKIAEKKQAQGLKMG